MRMYSHCHPAAVAVGCYWQQQQRIDSTQRPITSPQLPPIASPVYSAAAAAVVVTAAAAVVTVAAAVSVPSIASSDDLIPVLPVVVTVVKPAFGIASAKQSHQGLPIVTG